MYGGASNDRLCLGSGTNKILFIENIPFNAFQHIGNGEQFVVVHRGSNFTAKI